MSICLIDTSVFCNGVDVPGRNQQRGEVFTRLERLIREGTFLLLPVVVILETGNHVGQVPDGRLRRVTAERFAEQVSAALDGIAPWKPTPFVEADPLRLRLEEFPDHAGRGSGPGDLAIIKEWERQRRLHPSRRVFIWSFDMHLSSYDTGSQRHALNVSLTSGSPSIRIEGGLPDPDIADLMVGGGLPGEKLSGFGLEVRRNLMDEAAATLACARSLWKVGGSETVSTSIQADP